MEDPFTLEERGIRLAVRLTPRARKSGVAGLIADADGRVALAIRVAAPPVEGAANQALIRCLADMLGVSKSSVEIVSGQTSRLKMVHVLGDPETLAERTRNLIPSM